MQVISLSFLASISFLHLKELDNKTSVEKKSVPTAYLDKFDLLLS
jgi:hypothetical protein